MSRSMSAIIVVVAATGRVAFAVSLWESQEQSHHPAAIARLAGRRHCFITLTELDWTNFLCKGYFSFPRACEALPVPSSLRQVHARAPPHESRPPRHPDAG